MPFPGLSGLHGPAFLAALVGGIYKTAEGLLLQFERLGVVCDGLSGAVQFLDGVPDLLVAQDTSCGEVGRHGEPLGQARLLEGGISNWARRQVSRHAVTRKRKFTDWLSSSGVSSVSGARCCVAHRTRSDEFGPDSAALTAAASNDASYTRRILTSASPSILEQNAQTRNSRVKCAVVL